MDMEAVSRFKTFRITKAVNNIVQQMRAFICLGADPHASSSSLHAALYNMSASASSE
jgi:hypothetical protein